MPDVKTIRKDDTSQSFHGTWFVVEVQNSPEGVSASVALTWHLSFRPAISTVSAPSCSEVQFDDGTHLTPA